MVLLPEERGMTLAELRQIAARQQHQIEAQQQLLVAKEQRLKFLKQQEARHHNFSEQHLESNCLITLRDKVEAQELKLRQLRALRGQVEQQKTNNSNLGSELDSIRALFCEKERELDLAVTKVEELSRQLDEIKKNSQKSYLSSTSELENLRRELTYRTELSEQQNNYICQQREKINNRQQDIGSLDQKINELNERLHRKRLLNDQFASQIHLASLSSNSNCPNFNNKILAKSESKVAEILEPEHSQDDLATNLHGHHKCDFGEFSLTKNDPKYQTLPYNTKFTLKEKHLEDFSSSSTEDESSSKSDISHEKKDVKPSANMYNFSPCPFNNVSNYNSKIKKVFLQITDDVLSSQDIKTVTDGSSSTENADQSKISSQCANISSNLEPANSKPNKSECSSNLPAKTTPKPCKPAVPPKPALSVKPILANQENIHLTQRKKDFAEQDAVNMALSFLKNRSTEKEKNDFRYSVAKDCSQDPLLPKSRILTYFSKTLLQPEGSGHNKNEKKDSVENQKRKPAFEQLPIKPKPLTIRKNPSIEPPKLKVQSVTSTPYRQKVIEPIAFISKVSKNFSTPETAEENLELTSNKIIDVKDKNIESQPLTVEYGVNQSKSETQNSINVNEIADQRSDENADFKSIEAIEAASEEADYLSDHSSTTDVDDSSSLHETKKGNLKCESSIRVSRRVSFDPLALLLDAALEGELELVKKIASEVVNPSAANDEGITALHNAICAGQFEVVKFLVEFGCDVNAPDSDGWTPLHCAASCNNLAMVKFLIERGACIFSTTLSDQETAAEKCEEDGAGFDGCSEYLFSLQDNLGIMNDGKVYAVYDYDGQNADELSFRSGDMLTVLRRSDDEENEWWWCRLNDEEGYVPRNLLGLYPRVTCPNAQKPS